MANRKNFRDFVTLSHSIKDRGLFEDFLMGVTTPSERRELVRRIEIIKLLLEGHPQQSIAEDLGVGVATVTRGARELAQGRFKVMRKHS